MVSGHKRRDFLRIAVVSGALALAGCIGGGNDGAGNGDGAGSNDGAGGTTTRTTATTTPSESSDTTTVVDLPDGSCESLTARGFSRFDPSGKPIFFDFETPNGWKFSGVDLPSVYGASFITEVDIEGESNPFIISFTLDKEPKDLDRYNDEPSEGWTTKQIDFGGTTVEFQVSLEGWIDGNASSAITIMPFESDGDVTYHLFTFDVGNVGDTYSECEDILIEIRDHLVESIRPNPNHTFTPYYEEE